MRVLCPSCDSEMDPHAEACPVCLRKRTRQEIFAGLRGEESPRQEKKRSGFAKALLWGVLGASLVGYGLQQKVTLPGPLQEPPRPKAKEHWLDDTLPPVQTPAPQEPPAKGPAPPGAAPAAAGRPASDHWLVSGKVFDLLDLKPAAGAAVAFSETFSGEVFSVKTDAQGGYTARLPKKGDAAYQVTVRAKGYRKDYLEDSEPSFLLRSAAGRREAARMLDESQVLHVPVSPDKEADSVTYNFALVPLRVRGGPPP